MSDGAIGFIDSGIGGITTLCKTMELLPCESYIYLADFSSMPYGNKPREFILARTVDNCYTLLNRGCKAIVVACNTATNVGISFLRNYDTFLSKCIYVGLEPAVMPAVRSGAKKILVLVTEATAKQSKFRRLIYDYSDRLIISPQPRLASEIEHTIGNSDKLDALLKEVMEPFPDVDAVVLGCTHYVFLKDCFARLYGEKYKIFDGNEGAAVRLKTLLQTNGLLNETSVYGSVEFIRK